MTDSVLETCGLAAGYGQHAVVRDLSFDVQAGEVVALLGPNGSGKTTIVRTVCGVLPPLGGEVRFLGRPTTESLHRRARKGLALVPEQRSVFTRLSTAENLRVGRADTDSALAIFPELRPLMRRRGGLLSGGEQQMLTLGRALSRAPRLLVADELSLGLAPMAVGRLLVAVRAAADRGVGVLLVEQGVSRALRVADRVLVLERGEVVLSGSAAEVGTRVEEIERSYLRGRRGATRPASDE